MNIVYYYPNKELMFYCYHRDLYDIEKLMGEIESQFRPFRLIVTDEEVGYTYKIGDRDKERGLSFNLVSYVTIWYQDDFRKEYSPEFITEMEIQEKVWQFKLLFKKLSN